MGEFFKTFTASLLGAVLGSFIAFGTASGIVWNRYGAEVTAAANAVSQIARAQKSASDFKNEVKKHWHF